MGRPFSTSRFVRTVRLVTAAAFAPAGAAVHAVLAPVLGTFGSGTVAVALGAAIVTPLGARVRFGFQDARRPRWLGGLVVPLFDVLWSTAILSPVAALLAAVVAVLARAFGAQPSIGGTLAGGLALSGALASYGVLVRRRWVRRRTVEVAIEGLPAAFDGYRVAHLSDLHVGSITTAVEAMAWVRATNALDADLVAVTGDLLTTGTAFHDDVVEVVSALRARDGVHACLGNHDYYAEDRLCERLTERGVHVHRNAGVAVRRGDDALFVAGVEDLWRGAPDLRAALRARPTGATSVLLAHNPDFFPRARDAGVDLVLSGHTHAGQIAVPFFVERAGLSHVQHRWAAGLHRDGRAQIFVHAGLGTTGPAIRIGAAPEIVVIVLRRSGG